MNELLTRKQIRAHYLGRRKKSRNHDLIGHWRIMRIEHFVDDQWRVFEDYSQACHVWMFDDKAVLTEHRGENRIKKSNYCFEQCETVNFDNSEYDSRGNLVKRKQSNYMIKFCSAYDIYAFRFDTRIFLHKLPVLII